MYISHFIAAPFLLQRFFPSKSSATALALASVAPDILSSLYMIMMELIRMVFGQKMVIHDHAMPPGWVDLDTREPLGIGEWTHSFRGAIILGMSGYFAPSPRSIVKI